MSSGIFTRKTGELSITRFSKAVLISQDSTSLRGAIGVLRKSLLLVFKKSHNLVLSCAMATSNPTHKQIERWREKGKREREEEIGKERANKTERGSGGEDNERQMANNVMREIGIVMGTWYGWLLRKLPGNGAKNSSCYLLSTVLDFLEEERMM